MVIMPSQVDTGEHFKESAFRDFSREVVARNLVIAAQVTAFVTGVDQWPLFRVDDYEAFRRTTGESVDFIERGTLSDLVREGFLGYVGEGTDILEFKEPFLHVVAEFRAEEAATVQ